MVEKIRVCGVCFSQVANDSLQVCQHCNASLSYSRLATVVDAEKLKSHYDNKTIDRKIIESLSPQENKPFPWNKVSMIILTLISIFWIYNKVFVDKSFLDKNQIPAKIYEYLRAGKPILGLTDHFGDTANVLRQAGCTTIADLNSANEILDILVRFLDGDSAHGALSRSVIVSASRFERTKHLAELADRLA